ncbi:MAG: hypothetical protein ABFS32_20000 [Bacteroidota bacterium]
MAPKPQLYWIIAIILVILDISGKSLAQSGTYFTTNYNPAEYNFDNSNYEAIQDKQGVMHFANRQGVLNYDGNDWWLTPIPFSVFTMTLKDDILYVGGREGFGRISQTSTGEHKYVCIDSLHRNIIRSTYLGDWIFYIDEHTLYTFYKTQSNKVDTVLTNESELLDLVVYNNNLYVTTADEGIKKVIGESLVKPDIDIQETGYFLRKSPNGSVLYLSDSNNIFVKQEEEIRKLDFEDKTFVGEHTITEIIWASDSLIAISTMSGGVVFVNAKTGKTDQIINYNTGIPDNEITKIYADKKGSIWAIHPYGFSVISPELPLRRFDHYPGLKGSLVNVIFYKNQLYIGTSLGVYRLNEKPQVRSYVKYNRVRVRIDTEQEEEVEERRGLFRKSKKKKDVKEVTPTYKYVYKKRIVNEVLASNYEYEKIKGINSKAVQIIDYNNQLLVGTVHGVYRVDGDTAIEVNEVPVLNMYGLDGENLLFISSLDDEIKVLTEYQGAWGETKLLKGLQDYIYQVTLDPEENIWLCGTDSLYRLQLERKELQDVEVYKIVNPYFERVYSVNFEDKILFINSSGYYAYEDLGIRRQDYIQEAIGLPQKYVLGHKGELLLKTGSNWYGKNNNIKESLNFLNLFKDPHFIASDNKGYYWVVTASNELFRMDTEKLNELSALENIYLKEIRNNENNILDKLDLEVEQKGSSLTFEFASPDYSGIYRKEYQFRLSSSNTKFANWSKWSSANNVISYQFLPPGTYTLEARYRNSLGQIVEAKPFGFTIVPPYWKQPWFYVSEVLFFSALLFLSFYLNRGKGKFSFFSRLLGFLTIILIVEFFQTMAEIKFGTVDSPVINFFIQAFVALLILPIENLVRKRMASAPVKHPGNIK